MEFTNPRNYGTIKRGIDIVDGPVMAHPNSSTAKKLRVKTLTLTFNLKGGEWVVDSWTSLSISGVVLKKDGTEGKETWGGSVHYSWEKRSEYDWVRKVIEAMRPEGAPVLPFRLTGLENDDLEED